MGSYDDIAKKLDQKKIHVTEEDLHALDNVVSTQDGSSSGDLDGKTKEELKMASQAIEAISTFNPYDHQGEEGHEMDGRAGGPVFEQSIELLPDVPKSEDISGDVDAMSMMQEAAAATPAEAPLSSPPQNVPPAQPPANVPPSGPPANVAPAQPPANSPPPQPPAFSPPPPPPTAQKKEDQEG